MYAQQQQAPVAKKKVEVSTTVVAGRKRIGKSNETIRQLHYTYLTNSHRKGLIFDYNNEYGTYMLDQYQNGKEGIINPNALPVRIKALPHHRITAFNSQQDIEIRRIVPINDYGVPLSMEEQENLIIRMMTEFRGGCLFIEDLNTVFGDIIPTKVSGFLTNNAHRNCDVILHLQDIGRPTPKMWQNINVVRVHKMLEGVESAKKKLYGSFELFRITELMVEDQYAAGNTRYFLYADKDEHKIRGNYTAAMLLKAVSAYIDLYCLRSVKMIADIRDENTGRKIYNFSQAKQILKTEKFKKYFSGTI